MQRNWSEHRSSIRALGSAISTTMLSSCWLPSGLHTRSAWNARYEQLFVYNSPFRKWSNSGAEYHPLQMNAASRDSSCWGRTFQSQFAYHITGRLSLQGQLMLERMVELEADDASLRAAAPWAASRVRAAAPRAASAAGNQRRPGQLSGHANVLYAASMSAVGCT